jgi:hypothetical protein
MPADVADPEFVPRPNVECLTPEVGQEAVGEIRYVRSRAVSIQTIPRQKPEKPSAVTISLLPKAAIRVDPWLWHYYAESPVPDMDLSSDRDEAPARYGPETNRKPLADGPARVKGRVSRALAR